MPSIVLCNISPKNVQKSHDVRKPIESSVRSNALRCLVSKCGKQLLLSMLRATILPSMPLPLFSPVERCVCRKQKQLGALLFRNSGLSFEDGATLRLGQRNTQVETAELQIGLEFGAFG